MAQIRRILGKKTIFIILISFVLCSTIFALKNIGIKGIESFINENDNYIAILNKAGNGEALSKKENKLVGEYVKYISEYPQNIQGILANAGERKQFDIFGKDEYIRQNIDKTFDDYSRLKDVVPVIINSRGFDSYIEYIPVISVFVIFIIIYCLFGCQSEYDNGEILFTYSAKNGRMRFALKRNVIFTVISLVLVFVFNLSIIILSGVMYGFADFSVPVQSSMLFKDCTYTYSIGEFCVINALHIGISIAMITFLISFLFNVLKNKYVSVLMIIAIFGLEWRFSILAQNNTLNRLLANINIYRLIDFSSYYRNYQNIKLFGLPCSSMLVMQLITALLFVILFVLSGLAYWWRYPIAKSHFARIKGFVENSIEKVHSKLNFVFMELCKIFIRKGKVIIVLALVIGECVIINNTWVYFPERQAYMDSIYAEYGGADWERFDAYVADYQKQMEEKSARLAEIKEIDFNTDLREAVRLEAELDEMQFILHEYSSVQERKALIQEQKDVTVYAMSDRGYCEIFGTNAIIREIAIMVILVIAATILGAGYYLEEKQTNVIRTMQCTKNGIRKMFVKKLTIIMAVVLILTVLILVIDYYQLATFYGYKFTDAPLLSLSFMEDKIPDIMKNITIGQYVILDALLKVFATLAILGATLVLSIKSRHLFFVPAVILVGIFISCLSVLGSVLIKAVMLIALILLLLLSVVYIWRGKYGINSR